MVAIIFVLKLALVDEIMKGCLCLEILLTLEDYEREFTFFCVLFLFVQSMS